AWSSTLWLVLGLVVGAGVTMGAVMAAAAWLSEPTGGEALEPPLFVEVGDIAGIVHRYDGEFEYFVGGGVATFDCNSDRLPDLYLAGGSRPAALYVNETVPKGDLSFVSQPGSETDLVGVTGAYPIDIDSDGHMDLVVLRRGENVVLRGTGRCQFERANETWNIQGGDEWTVAFSAFWESGEELPTLAFGNYLRIQGSGDRDECEDHFLFRPADADSYAGPETLSPGHCTLSILFSDWNRSGSPDLRMTNDRHYYTEGEEQLWEIDDGARRYGAGDGWRHLKIWGMGIASQDLDGDLLPEVFLTSQGDNKLQTLVGDGSRPEYEDIALASGVTAHRPFQGDNLRPSTAWHAEFDDVNNDGLWDLFVTKGNVDAQIDFAAEDPNNLLIGQRGGLFAERAAEAGLLDMNRSRGAVVVDLDLDGALDVVVVERRVPARIWQNTGQTSSGGSVGNWLSLEVGQPGWNRNAVGSWVEIQSDDGVVTREMTVGGGHASGEMAPIHFGLGDRAEARVRVIWPDGETTPWRTLPANGRFSWERGSDPNPLPGSAD
ncbi:MAG TPA: CRTAC1 family protein, partial [Acidimicrobiia bacterium]